MIRLKGNIYKLCTSERILALLPAVWLQVVGVVTHSIVHHILHALPILLLVVLPQRTFRVRQTAALTGLIWIIMLAMISPMIHEALFDGITLSLSHKPYTWLAPGMVILCSIWSGYNIYYIIDRSHRWFWFTLGLLALSIIFAIFQPWVSQIYNVPVDRVLEGNILWLLVLVVELCLTLLLPWIFLYYINPDKQEPLSFRSIMWQIVYWVGFLLCMIIGLHPALN